MAKSGARSGTANVKSMPYTQNHLKSMDAHSLVIESGKEENNKQSYIKNRLDNTQESVSLDSSIKIGKQYQDDSTLKNTINSLHNVKIEKHEHLPVEDLDLASYFKEQATTLYEEEGDSGAKAAPTALLVEPYTRKETPKSKFNLAPCSGGLKGSARYVASQGEKTKVQWIIKNPVAGGQCKIRISKGHPDDLASYDNLIVDAEGYNRKTGEFK